MLLGGLLDCETQPQFQSQVAKSKQNRTEQTAKTKASTLQSDQPTQHAKSHFIALYLTNLKGTQPINLIWMMGVDVRLNRPKPNLCYKRKISVKIFQTAIVSVGVAANLHGL